MHTDVTPTASRVIQPSTPASNQNLTAGILLMFGAFFCFASMDTSAKWLVAAAIPSLQVAFVRYLFHFLWVIIIYLPREGLGITRSGNPKLQSIRACLLLTSTACNFTALYYLPLTTTIAIFFAAPIVVCLLSIPLLGEKVGVRRFAAVFVGFIGVLIIVQPCGDGFDWHFVFAFLALLGASGYFVMSRMIAGIDSNAVTQWYAAGIATVVLAPAAYSVWVWPTNATDWGLMVLLGTFGMLGHSLLTRAHHLAEASKLAPTVYSQIIYITLFSWIIFDTPPDWNTTIGTAVIVGSGLYIWYRERQARRQQQ